MNLKFCLYYIPGKLNWCFTVLLQLPKSNTSLYTHDFFPSAIQFLFYNFSLCFIYKPLLIFMNFLLSPKKKKMKFIWVKLYFSAQVFWSFLVVFLYYYFQPFRLIVWPKIHSHNTHTKMLVKTHTEKAKDENSKEKPGIEWH